MKRILFIMTMALVVVGCQRRVEELQKNVAYSYDDQLEVEIVRTEAVHSIEPSNKNMFMKFITAQEGNIYIDVVLRVKNISSDQVSLDNTFSGDFRISGITYNLNQVVESINYTVLSSTDTMKTDEERLVHLYCEVPETYINKEILLRLNVLEHKDLTHSFIVENEVQETNYVRSVGDVLALKQSELTLSQISQLKRIEPSQKGLFYTYIPTENDDETFIVLKTELYNTTESSLSLEEYIYCEYHINGETIKSQMIMESENHKSLTRNGGRIETLQRRTVYFAMPVKDSLLNNPGQIELYVEGETYQIH